MKIAFILSNGVVSPSNGIVNQAKTWRKALEKFDHDVVLINMWDNNDWASFDIIHLFGFSVYMRDFINELYKINSHIVVSPILDPDYSISRLKLYSRFGISKLNLSNQFHSLFSIKDKIRAIFVRSEFEKQYMEKGFGFKNGVCIVLRLSYNLQPHNKKIVKEPFCFHLSLLMDDRKNVKRLIQAAIKFNFKLILAGRIRNNKELKLLSSWIGNNKNIMYKGYLSNEELLSYYAKAKVFALPSINEGVGIVGLEAASMGCDLVITNLGGPKEYYNGLAKIINPYSIDEIGNAVVDLLQGQTFQPQLKNHVQSRFSLDSISQQLVDSYKKII